MKNMTFKSLGYQFDTSWISWSGCVGDLDVRQASHIFVSASHILVAEMATTTFGDRLVVALEDGIWARGDSHVPKDIPLRWWRLRHLHLGGVTTGVFWISTGTTHDLIADLSAHVERVLTHVLQSAMPLQRFDKKVTAPPASMILHSPDWDFTTEQWLPLSNPRGLLLCPSVFPASKWIIRRLSLDELADCFDLSGTIKRVLLSPEDIMLDHQFDFLLTMPGKVVANVIHRLGLDGLMASHRPMAIMCVELGKHLVYNELPKTILVDVPLEDQREQVAVQHDDAKVPVHLWNNRIVDKSMSLATMDPICIDYALECFRSWFC